VTPDAVREFALSLDGATERDHHGSPSFRRRTIFATLPDDEHLHVMLTEEEIRDLVDEFPGFCEEKWWGKQLAAVRIDLPAADDRVVRELLEDSWRQHG
jgi:YjbR